MKVHELIAELEQVHPNMEVVGYPKGCGCCTYTRFDDIENVSVKRVVATTEGYEDPKWSTESRPFQVAYIR